MFRELTRSNKQLPMAACIEVLQQQTRGVLSVLGDDGYPYGMPMNHWYEPSDGCVYFHCGRQSSHRMDAILRCPKASFCVYDQGTPAPDSWALQVRSVILFGQLEVLDDPDTICRVCTSLCRKFTQDEAYIREELEAYGHETLLLRLRPAHMRGKLVTES